MASELISLAYVFSERCTEKLPLRVDVIHRVEFGEVSGHRVFIKRGPGNRGPTIFFEHELPQQTEHTPMGRGRSQADSCRDEEAHSPLGVVSARASNPRARELMPIAILCKHG